MDALRPAENWQSHGPGDRRTSFDVDREVARSVFPHQQKFMDQYVCPIYRRVRDVIVRGVLLDCRYACLAGMGFATSRVWQKRDSCLCPRSAGGGNAVYGLALIGALVYYIQHANGFWLVILGILKALVWPAFVIYDLLRFLAA